ncbi:oligosaccharide biosynthesis protein Alg14 like protein [Serendipita vermifera]|nr:oligosaccharide biosynthesis protein Alg14 like protein [Serendipita vermifera]
MLQLLKGLDVERYGPRKYILSAGDHLSAKKAAEFESEQSFPSSYSIAVIPRARRVLQPLWTVPITTIICLLVCFREITLKALLRRERFADLLLLNGPGTCVPIFVACFVNRILGLHSPRVIYVESFTRVNRLSLSGRLLRPVVDCFVVQWPNLLSGGGSGYYEGWLI